MPSPAPTVPEVAGALGLDPEGAEVVRSASRLVMRFPRSGVRTFAVPGGASVARDEAAVADLLADAGVPAARRVVGPVAVDGWLVTAWREIEIASEAPTGATLGTLAARLHDATAGLDPRGLPRCDPIGAALAQVELAVAAGATPEADLAILRRLATRMEAVWRAALDATTTAPPRTAGEAPDLDAAASRARRGAVLHGDLHPGNVVMGTTGPALVDLELAGWGPAAFDAAPSVALVRWYGHDPAQLEAFDAAYGAPLTAAARAQGLDEVWGLWATAWSVANRHRSEEAAAEARTRLATWAAAGRAPRAWVLS